MSNVTSKRSTKDKERGDGRKEPVLLSLSSEDLRQVRGGLAERNSPLGKKAKLLDWGLDLIR